MRTFRSTTQDERRLAWWLWALASVAVTASIFAWLPRWVPTVRAVSLAGAVVAIVWLWIPACKRWFARHWNRTP